MLDQLFKVYQDSTLYKPYKIGTGDEWSVRLIDETGKNINTNGS